MSADRIFLLAHVPAAIAWAALLLPIGAFRLRRRIAIACGCVLGSLYLILFSDPASAVLARDYSLAGVAAFFDVPRLQLAGWTHYLVIDLWAGIWQAEQADRKRMPRWQSTASLLLTAAVAPAGLLLFLLFDALPNFAKRNGEGLHNP